MSTNIISTESEIETDVVQSISLVQVVMPLAKLFSVFSLISILQLPVVMMLLSSITMFVAYRLTLPIQASVASLTEGQSQVWIKVPILFFSTVWLTLLLKYGLSAGSNIVMPCFLLIVIAAYGPVFFRFGTKPIKPRKLPYSFSYTITMVIGFLIVVGLNFNEFFM